MDFFKKLFGFEKKENTNTRTIQNLERGLKNDYVLHYQIATEFYIKGNLIGALEAINKVIQTTDISDWKHYAFRANIYEDQKNYTAAITDYSKAIELSNDQVQVYPQYHQTGYCYLNLGNNKKADEFYSAAIELKLKHPNHEYNPDLEGMDGGVLVGLPIERLYNNRGNARKNLGMLNDAFEDCKTAINYNPNYSNSYLLAGQIQQLAGNLDDALSLLNQAIQLGNPNAKKIYEQLAASMPKKAAVLPNKEAELILQKSMNACDSGDYQTAIKLGEELIKVYNLPTGYYALGLVYAVLENWQLAKQNCLQAHKYFPNVVDNLNRLGVAYCSLNEIREGLIYFRKGVELNDTNCRANYSYWKDRL